MANHSDKSAAGSITDSSASKPIWLPRYPGAMKTLVAAIVVMALGAAGCGNADPPHTKTVVVKHQSFCDEKPLAVECS